MRLLRVVTVLVLGLVALRPCPVQGQAGTLTPSPKFIAFTDAGAPCGGCKLYTYSSGTSTPLATYQESTLSIAHANPVVLDAAGRATIYLSATSYKFTLKTSGDATIWSVDPVTAVNVAQAIGETFHFGGDVTTPITATNYPSGTTVDKLHAGTSIYNVDSSNLTGTYRLEGMVKGGGAGGSTITIALMNLSDGNPDTAMVSVSGVSATGLRLQSGNITWPSGGSAKNYGIKVTVDGNWGYAWGLKIVRVS